jgi:hypothetical protein
MRLPNFLIIGAAKGGTTSLHYYLRQHPEVFLPRQKEINFYWPEARALGRQIPDTIEEYARYFEGAGTARAVGEISPQYINSPSAAERIAADLRGVRLVVSLRSPAERAYSDYLGRVRIAREARAIDDAIRPGERIFEHGFYHVRLKPFYDRFSRERIHVILHEDYTGDPATTLRTLFGFLDVDPGVPIDTSTRHNPAELPRSPLANRLLWAALPRVQRFLPDRWRGTGLAEPLLRRTYREAPPLSPDLRRRLTDAYRADIEATASLIGRDLTTWLSPE